MADSVINYSDLIGKDDTFEDIFENLDKLEKRLSELAKQRMKDLEMTNPNNEKALKQAVKDVENLTKASKKLETERKKAVKTRKKLADLSDEELIQREKLKIANRERVQIAKQQAIITNKESGQIEILRATLALTTLEWKKLSAGELKNTKRGKNLIKTKKNLTNQLKKLEKQTGDTRRNVGNYTQSLGKLGKVAAGIFVGRNLVAAIRNVGRAFVDIFNANKEGNADFEKFEASVTGVIEKLKGIGLAIINAVLPIVQKAIRTFQFFANKISAASTEGSFLGSVFEKVKGFILGTIAILQDIPFIYTGIIAASKQLASNIGDAFTKLGKSLSIIFLQIEKVNPFSDRNKSEIEANINDLRSQIDGINESQKGVGEAFREAYDGAKKEFAEFNKAQDIEDAKNLKRQKAQAGAEKRREAALKKQNELVALQGKLQQNINIRIAAIISLQNKIETAEANSIKDAQKRLLRLEELKAKAINEQREKDFAAFVSKVEEQEESLLKFYGENSAEVIEFREEAGKILLDAEDKNQRLSELQLQESEARKIKIREKFAIQAIDIQTVTISGAIEEQQKKDVENVNKNEAEKNEKRLLAEKVRARQEADAAAKRADREKELLEGIAETSKKIGAAINSAFEKQLGLASSLVEQQADAVETQRQRAEQGLDDTLAFEQKKLAEREADRIRAEKKAKQAAEFITLLNLVSSYASSGDTNALARALVDFSLLKALETGLGFEEGGYTGDNGTSQISGVVHGQEYVVKADDVKRFGLSGKGGDEFGEAMSDYFYSPLQQNLYDAQANTFKSGVSVSNSFASLENEVKEMRRAFQSMPQKDFDLLQMTDYFVEISKRVTQNRMTNVSKQRKRL